MQEEILIGQLLKRAREDKKLSIKDIAKKTKINVNILKALEDNNMDALPNRTYVKGFVQNYAKTVGLDVNEAIQALRFSYQDQDKEEVSQEKSSEDYTQTPHTLSEKQLEMQEKVVNFLHGLVDKRVVISVIAVVGIIFITKGIFNFFSQISNEQIKITDTSKELIKGEDESLFELESSKKIREEVHVEATQELKPAEQVPPVAETVVAEVKVEEKKEEATPKIVSRTDGKFPYKHFYAAPTEMFDILNDADENDDDDLLPEKMKDAIESGKENVFINATEGDTWLSYKADDEKIKRFVLKQGRSILIKGEKILLFLGNINVTKIFYNNKLISVKSRTGVKSLIFPESAAKDHVLPLFPTYQGVPYDAKKYQENMAEKSASDTDESTPQEE